MAHGLANCRENIFVVEYEELVSDSKNVLKNIYNFLGIETFENHNCDDIHNFCAEEKDAAWGLKDLHKIRKKLEPVRSKAKELLGRDVTNWIYENYKWFFEQFKYSK